MSESPQRPSSVLSAVKNPPNPFHRGHLFWDEEPPPRVELKVYEDHSKSILSKNESPDLPFTWSLNPYRGCMHACAYCYARPSHEYLDLGAGTDFDRRIVVKPDAAALLRATFDDRKWMGEYVMLSGNTDCYQPLEASYGLTRQCLEVLLEYRNPCGIITKSGLVTRDVDLLSRLHAVASVGVTLSIPYIDPIKARKVEPFAPTPRRRFAALRALSDAGIPCGVNVAPIIPGLNDEDIPGVLEAAREAGARWAGYTLVRLPGPVNAIFEERIRAAFPDRAERILHRIEDCRGGERSESRFGLRMRGTGNYWEAIRALFHGAARRLGFPDEHLVSTPATAARTFRRPGQAAQLDLFGHGTD